MIKLQDLTPEVYYKQSRDFQFIGRLYDIVLNYSKTNAANLCQLPIGDNMNEQLLNLLALTLGFKPTKNYNSKQLLAICSVLPDIMRNKGSLNALIIAANALLTAEGIEQALDYTIIPKQSITLYVSQQLSDLNLLKDLLDYILPAGISCGIVKELQARAKIETIIGIRDDVNVYPAKQAEELSTIADKNLVLGSVGDNKSIMANVTVTKKDKEN
jgi:hypothetical protein